MIVVFLSPNFAFSHEWVMWRSSFIQQQENCQQLMLMLDHNTFVHRHRPDRLEVWASSVGDR